MKVIRRLICGGVLLVAGYITCWGQDGAKPTPLTMCELYEHPEQYSGKMVKVRGGSLGAELSISNVTLDGPVKTCSAFLDIIVLFPWQVNPSPGFDVVRDESFAKLEDAINSRVMRIDATYEGRFDLLHVIRDGKRINVTTGKAERRRVGKMSYYDARIVLHQVSDVSAFEPPRK